MRKLETFVNEKLRVTKASGVPNLISILESTNRKEYNLQCENLLAYLKDDSGLPVAELEDWDNAYKKLERKYQNTDDTFLWVRGSLIHYGTWDKMYNMYWSRLIDGVKNYRIDKDGFKNFACNDQEIMESKGVFIITENKELLKQIDILMKKSELTV